ncbi:hypothetical protein B0J14DRAFT_658773 [Halenospora varia]|nr:hypothetical protein B0J14DRAFT_658773 [Halenospora varia]
MVPSEVVFYKLFDMEESKKAWKQKKIPLEDFKCTTGGLTASIRYRYLRVVGKDIILRWYKENNSFTVSGSYGM